MNSVSWDGSGGATTGEKGLSGLGSVNLAGEEVGQDADYPPHHPPTTSGEWIMSMLAKTTC
ncbi:MAG: hypothetical protein ISR43_09200 [Acidimicrobiia bacterium]|nr:hypothetical protein [Actinomycetota bacterium]MBL6927388.1 hypothetical protein [Acidimicrobiia bacterium]